MKLHILKNKKLGDKRALGIIRKQILSKPSLLIGLAVGKTTDGLYNLISRDVVRHPKQWRNIKLFQIDENLGISPNSHLSFNHEIKRELKPLFKTLNPKNIFLMDGTEKPKEIIKKGYKFIKQNKGIDLVILGLGQEHDPHIAYNTTGKSSLNSRMRVVELHPKVANVIARKLEKLTKQSHKSHMQNKIASPSARNDIRGITLGLKDILEARKVLLIAYGKEKAKSLHLTLKKVDMKKASASALLLHKDLEIVVDKDASCKIKLCLRSPRQSNQNQ